MFYVQGFLVLEVLVLALRSDEFKALHRWIEVSHCPSAQAFLSQQGAIPQDLCRFSSVSNQIFLQLFIDIRTQVYVRFLDAFVLDLHQIQIKLH